MRFIADFHIHSRYSRACSPQLTPENLATWSRLKGIQVLGTGDCIHPAWLAELKEKLEPAGNGLYRLKSDCAPRGPGGGGPDAPPVYFLLTTEISSIYKKNGRVRKVHTICVLPDFDAADRLQARLERVGNIRSDGRPILGLDCRPLVEMVLESGPLAYAIPAHIWTPWFSLLGSNSGFDSLEECFEDLAPEIFAVETGLSSDPPMNRACAFLDRVRLVSNSDAHSPEKLGREANLFDAELSYAAIYDALKHDRGFEGTIEFFPQEGKYHYDGHRKCEVRWNPLETISRRGVCAKCGRPVTRGVMHRVAELADRPQPESALGRQRFYSITPLAELLAEWLGQRSATGQAVKREYLRLVERLGPEFHILLFADLREIERAGGERLAAGIARLRNGEVSAESGYDGEFGRIRVFANGAAGDGGSLFQAPSRGRPASEEPAGRTRSVEFDIAEFQRRRLEQGPSDQVDQRPSDRVAQWPGGETASAGRADEQRAAIEAGEGVWMILAGPGSGKTHVLTERIAHLVAQRQVPAASVLAVTFSNRAAQEIRQRLAAKPALGPGAPVVVSTFHALGLSILREQWARVGRTGSCVILDEEARLRLLAQLPGVDKRAVKKTAEALSRWKQGCLDGEPRELQTLLARYEERLRQADAVDLDDLIWLPVRLLRDDPACCEGYRRRWRWILVDEYQDINARQYELMRLLAGDGAPKLFVIGDPDQAIYGFRGSDVRLIERLGRDYPSLGRIRLSRSWRCPETVLKGAGQVLEKDEPLRGTAEAVKIHIQACASAREEADWIAAKIEQLIGGVRSFSMHSGVSDGRPEEGLASFRDFAVLCRASALFPAIDEALAQHGIPCQVVGSEPFYRQEPWASILEAFRAAGGGHTASRESVGERLRGLMDRAGLAPDRQRMLLALAEPFGGDRDEFLRALALRQELDDHSAAAERVSVMTMHAAKGLEFQAVFVAGCEEGLIPFERFGGKDEAELAEEERLFYVAMTRTKRYLFLTHARKRLWRGALVRPARSRFVDRLERSLLELGARAPRKRPDAVQPLLFES